MYAATGGPNLK